MNRNLCFTLLYWLFITSLLGGCGLGPQPTPESDTQAIATRVAAEIYATQTAQAPVEPEATPTATEILPTVTATPTSSPTVTPTKTEESANSQTGDTLKPIDTPTPNPTDTPTPKPSPVAKVVADTVNLRAGPGTDYPVVGQGQQGQELPITGRNAVADWWQVVMPNDQTAWVVDELVEVSQAELVIQVDAPLPPPPLATPTPDQRWVLVADSAADFPGPIQDRKWFYFWSKGRGNFHWQDMQETPDCYRSPNEMTLAICRDRITVDTCDSGERPGRDCSRGDAALQWKAREGGTYRFEWHSTEADGKSSLWFYNHATYVGSQETGSELPYSATIPDVVQWAIFYWVPQYDTPYQVKVYKLVE
jgi:hypothetical protein